MSSKMNFLFCARYSSNEQPTYQEVKKAQLELKIEIPDGIKVQQISLWSFGMVQNDEFSF